MATATRRPRKQLTEAEQAERDAANEARIAEVKAAFDARLEAIANSPEEWREFLDTVAAFGAQYSIGNQILIAWQAEARGVNPQHFLPYGYAPWTTDPETGRRVGRDYAKASSGWLKEGRCVRRGEKGFWIWAAYPFYLSEKQVAAARAAGKKLPPPDAKGRIKGGMRFKIESTFELSQTDAITEKGEAFRPTTIEIRRRERLAGGKGVELLTGEDPTDAFDDVVKLIKDEGYSFELVAPGTGPLAGHPKANGITCWGPRAVAVRNDVAAAQLVKTSVHELAHILCEHETRGITRGQKETEAESVAHVVCGALGLDTAAYTDAYVLGWAGGDMKVVKEAASTVLKVSKKILAGLDPATEEKAAA